MGRFDGAQEETTSGERQQSHGEKASATQVSKTF